jgi:cell division protein FtsB
MRLLNELRIRARYVLGPAFGVCAVCYFAYHTVTGERGLIAWRALQHQVAGTRTQLADLRERRLDIEHRVRLLSPQSVDPDMLDEWARRTLNYGRAPETVVLIEPLGSKPSK